MEHETKFNPHTRVMRYRHFAGDMFSEATAVLLADPTFNTELDFVYDKIEAAADRQVAKPVHGSGK